MEKLPYTCKELINLYALGTIRDYEPLQELNKIMDYVPSIYSSEKLLNAEDNFNRIREEQRKEAEKEKAVLHIWYEYELEVINAEYMAGITFLCSLYKNLYFIPSLIALPKHILLQRIESEVSNPYVKDYLKGNKIKAKLYHDSTYPNAFILFKKLKKFLPELSHQDFCMTYPQLHMLHHSILTF